MKLISYYDLGFGVSSINLCIANEYYYFELPETKMKQLLANIGIIAKSKRANWD